MDLKRFAHGVLEVKREAIDLDVLVRDTVAELEADEHPVELDLTPVRLEVAPVEVPRSMAIVGAGRRRWFYRGRPTRTVRTEPENQLPIEVVPECSSRHWVISKSPVERSASRSSKWKLHPPWFDRSLHRSDP